MNIAVTGSAGVLGRAVVGLASSRGHTVVGVDRDPLPDGPQGEQIVQRHADVTDFDALVASLAGADAVVHLAAYVRPGGGVPDHVVHNSNVTGTFNVLSAAVALGIDRVCLASSVNAIGGAYSRRPRYDYFPVDERHPTYAEDPYSLSKWQGEQQADAIARRHEQMTIASLRLHALRDRADMNALAREHPESGRKDLWGYTPLADAAGACLAALDAAFGGHEVIYVVGPDTTSDVPSEQLRDTYYPDVPVTGDLSGHRGFFDLSKAQRVLGWSVNGVGAP